MAKFRFSKISLILVVLSAILAAAAWWYIRFKTAPLLEIPAGPFNSARQQPAPASAGAVPRTPAIPATFALKVPFTPQAPTANWDQLHNEACEEAAAIMAHAYFSGITAPVLPAADVEAQLGILTAWQQQHLGHNLDTTSAETAQMIEAVYNLKTKTLEDFSADDLKRELLAGHVVIISENGRLLGNPNYKQPGPVHHMLVIRGYTPEGFVTNDSGTRRGQNYFYAFETIKNAAGDWDPAANAVNSSRKIAIVVSN